MLSCRCHGGVRRLSHDSVQDHFISSCKSHFIKLSLHCQGTVSLGQGTGTDADNNKADTPSNQHTPSKISVFSPSIHLLLLWPHSSGSNSKPLIDLPNRCAPVQHGQRLLGHLLRRVQQLVDRLVLPPPLAP